MLALLLAAYLAYKFNKPKTHKILLIISGMWFFVIYISPIPLWLAENLERKYPVYQKENQQKKQTDTSHIMVLGAGYAVEPGFPSSVRLSKDELGRLAEALRIYRELDNAKVITSGNSSTNQITQAEMASLAALELGVSPADTMQLRNSTNTAGEATEYYKRFGNNNPLILVTSAIHMPRAIKWFENYKIKVIPAPTNYYILHNPEHPTFPFKPSLSKVVIMDRVIHEYLGMIYYYLFK